MATEAEKNEAKRQFELANPDGPGMSVNVGGYGNLIFKNDSVYDSWKKDPQNMTYSQGPGDRKYVEPKSADYDTKFKGAEFGGSGGGGKAKVDEDLNAGASAMKKGGVAKSAKYMSFSKTGKPVGMKKVTKMASGGMTSSASKRADGIATKGKTRGRFV